MNRPRSCAASSTGGGRGGIAGGPTARGTHSGLDKLAQRAFQALSNCQTPRAGVSGLKRIAVRAVNISMNNATHTKTTTIKDGDKLITLSYSDSMGWICRACHTDDCKHTAAAYADDCEPDCSSWDCHNPHQAEAK